MKEFILIVICLILGYIAATLTSISTELNESKKELISIRESLPELNDNAKKVHTTLVDIFSIKPDTEE